jgi:transposase
MELRVSLSWLSEQWRFATRPLIDIRRLLQEQAQVQPAREHVYRSVPGIGAIAARILATERGDMTRFAHERALCSSTGLTPSAYASGATVRRGHISRQGSSRVRHVLIEIAWRAIPRDVVLQEIFERIAATRGKKRAIVAIARRLVGRIRACFRQGTTYAVGTYA